MRSSRSIQLLILGSALSILGCGGQKVAGNCPVGADGKPIPGPDGKINPNCTKSSRSSTRTGFFVGAFGGMGGGARPGVAAPGTSTAKSFGGFGSTSGSAGHSSGASAAS